MKLTPEHFAQLQSIVTAKLEELGNLEPYFVQYRNNGGDWKKRFRWHALYAVPYSDRGPWFDEVYKYANDDHIDTALRKIMKDYMDV